MGETYKSCYWITSGLHFERREVRFCCYEYLHSNKKNILIPNYSGEKIDYERIFQIRDKYKNQAKNNNLCESCKDCIYLEEKEWSNENYFDHFIFNHWLKCNAKCIYCYQPNLPSKDRKIYYKVFPLLKDMRKNNLLKGTHESAVVFGGGEPVILNEFNKMLNLFAEENFKNIRVNSNGIKFSPVLFQLLKDGYASIVISPDSGSKDMYERIKRVKAFNVVWKNINKYAIANTKNIKIKYIIIPGINDSTQEIDNFFSLIKCTNIQSVALSIETNWYERHYPNFPKQTYYILDYFKEKANLLNLDIELYCEAIGVYKQRKD